MRISDSSSDVCSSDLVIAGRAACICRLRDRLELVGAALVAADGALVVGRDRRPCRSQARHAAACSRLEALARAGDGRSEEHTSELQSLMRISYAVFCLKKKNTTINDITTKNT